MSLATFTEQYITTMLWAETDESDESGGVSLDENYSTGDIAPESIKEIEQDCAAFYEHEQSKWTDDDKS